jgi:hypothetical protein
MRTYACHMTGGPDLALEPTMGRTGSIFSTYPPQKYMILGTRQYPLPRRVRSWRRRPSSAAVPLCQLRRRLLLHDPRVGCQVLPDGGGPVCGPARRGGRGGGLAAGAGRAEAQTVWAWEALLHPAVHACRADGQHARQPPGRSWRHPSRAAGGLLQTSAQHTCRACRRTAAYAPPRHPNVAAAKPLVQQPARGARPPPARYVASKKLWWASGQKRWAASTQWRRYTRHGSTLSSSHTVSTYSSATPRAEHAARGLRARARARARAGSGSGERAAARMHARMHACAVTAGLRQPGAGMRTDPVHGPAPSPLVRRAAPRPVLGVCVARAQHLRRGWRHQPLGEGGRWREQGWEGCSGCSCSPCAACHRGSGPRWAACQASQRALTATRPVGWPSSVVGCTATNLRRRCKAAARRQQGAAARPGTCSGSAPGAALSRRRCTAHNAAGRCLCCIAAPSTYALPHPPRKPCPQPPQPPAPRPPPELVLSLDEGRRGRGAGGHLEQRHHQLAPPCALPGLAAQAGHLPLRRGQARGRGAESGEAG